MTPQLKEFIKTYLKALRNNNAAIFAGAGLSKPAGFVDWRDLLRDIASELSLDIDKETDLISIAQYHVNENDGRHKINQLLVDEFTKGVKLTKNHEILSSLPINIYWTTNYDNLIEQSLEKKLKRVDVKIKPTSLSTNKDYTDAIVYKMHGDICLPDEAIITKDDYEAYSSTHELFSTALRGDLVKKTFLFIGFSFDDPNLEYTLSRIRLLLGKNKRTHYCFMKKVSLQDYSNEDEYKYAEIKQSLRIKDLRRYCIKVILVNEYSDITTILETIECLLRRNNIFVSGSAVEYGNWNQVESYKFSSELGKKIIENDYDLVSGFGLGIGSSVISGALEELYKNDATAIDKRLKLWPFPFGRTELYQKYREDMLANVGIAIFMFGNKINKETNNLINADGVRIEFNLAVNNGAMPIPVGATGYMAEELWNEVMYNFGKYIPYPHLKPLFEMLGDKSKSTDELLKVIIDIIINLTSIEGGCGNEKENLLCFPLQRCS